MKNYLNSEHTNLVIRIVDSFLNDAKQEAYSKDYLRISETEICEIIRFCINPHIENLVGPFEDKSKVIKIHQLGLGLYLIGNDLQRKVSQELKQFRNQVRDPLMSFMDDQLFFINCVAQIFDEPINNFLEKDELSHTIIEYHKTVSPRLYGSYNFFECVTPFHYESSIPVGQKVDFNFYDYVRFWDSNIDLNGKVVGFRHERNRNQEDCWWYGRFDDFYELDKILEVYRDKKHDFLKVIFTLEHVFVYGICRFSKVKPEEIFEILSNTFNSFLPNFVNCFYSQEASLKASKVVKELLLDNLKRKVDWDEAKRKQEEREQQRQHEILSQKRKQEEELRESELRLVAAVTKVVMALSLLAVLPLPYGFYKILRICISIFSIFVFSKADIIFIQKDFNKNLLNSFLLIFLVIFNPILPIHLERSVWVFINISFSVMCFFLLKISKRRD